RPADGRERRGPGRAVPPLPAQHRPRAGQLLAHGRRLLLPHGPAAVNSPPPALDNLTRSSAPARPAGPGEPRPGRGGRPPGLSDPNLKRRRRFKRTFAGASSSSDGRNTTLYHPMVSVFPFDLE